MQSIIHLLKMKSAESNSEGYLATELLNYQGDLKSLKIREIVESVHVSAATATRLAQSIGLSGFNELCYSLDNERKQIDTQPTEYYNDTAQKYITEHHRALQDTAALLDYQLIKELAWEIAKCDQVIFFSIGTSYLKALDFEYKIRKLGIRTTTCFDYHQQILQAKLANERTVALAITYSGLTVDVIEMTEFALASHAKTYAITSNPSRLNSAVKPILISPREPQSRTLSITSVSTINFVLDLICLEIIKSDPEKFERILSANKLQK